MKDRIFSFYLGLSCVIFLLCTERTHAQIDQIILSAPDGGNKTYLANQRIEFLPGYTFTATSADKMVAYIDAGVVTPPFYTDLFTPNAFDTRELNTSYAVGALSGTRGVTETGAFNYMFPIQIPPGTSNMVPQLSIGYSSHAGNGLLGMGWSLQGMSMISRVNKDYHFNGEVRSVQLDNNDVFALDGGKLIGLSGIYGASGAEYATESEDFSRVYSRGSQGAGPEWFEVKTKEGFTIEYGKTTDARLNHYNGTVVYWLISRIKDPHGNYVEYVYENLNDELRIKEINYTGNTTVGMLPYNKIQFNYKERADPFDYYLNYKKIQNKSVLDNVVVLAEGQQFKKYEFKYGCKLYSFLNEVIEYGSGNQRFNSTIFKYDIESEGEIEVQHEVLTTSNNNTTYLTGDFNGDGKTDVVKVNAVNNGTSQGSDRVIISGQINYEILSNAGNDETNFQPIGSASISSSTFVVFGYGGSQSRYGISSGMNLFDFDGDSKTDIFYYNMNYDNQSNRYSIAGVRYHKAEVNSQGQVSFDLSATSPVSSLAYNYVRNVNQFSFIGDYNGDGIFDILYVTENQNANQFWVGISKGNPMNSIITGLGVMNQQVLNFSDGAFLASADRVEVIDYDGDGKSDLMIIKGGVTKIYTFKKGTISGMTTENYAELVYQAGFPTAAHDFDLGDFNGDGRTDLLTKSADGNIFTVHYSRSNNWFEPKDYTFKNAAFNASTDGWIVTDLNGDGKTDIIHAYNNQSVEISEDEIQNRTDITVYYSNGSKFDYESQVLGFATPDVVINHKINAGKVLTGNFNGKLHHSVILAVDYSAPPLGILGTEYHQLDLKINRFFNKMTGVKDGFNNAFLVEYDNLSNSSIGEYVATASNPSISPNYPTSNFNFPILMAKKITASTPTGDLTSKEFSYWGGKFHKKGKGFLGFSKVEQKDELTGITSVSEYQFHTPEFRSYLKKSKTFFTQTEELLSETEYEHTFIDLITDDRYLNYISEQQLTDHVLDRTVATLYEYNDITGNLVSTTVDKIGVETTLTEFDGYGVFGSDLEFVNKATESTVTVTRAGENPYVRTTHFNYDTETGTLLSVIHDPGSIQSVTKLMEYNSCGNMTKEILSSNGLPIRAKLYQYDSRRRFPIKQTNELGQESFVVYHPVFGKPQKGTDIHGLITETSFDAFGRPNQTIDASGRTKSTAILWENASPSNSPGGALEANDVMWKIVQSGSGIPESTVYMNRLGMKRMTKVQGMDNDIYTVMSYNEKGGIHTESAPFYMGATGVLVKNYTYDELSRVTAVSTQSGTTSVAYAVVAGKLKTTTTSPDGTVKTNEQDAAGKMVKSTDEGGALVYTYFSHGGMKQVKLDGVAVASSEYDQYARQIKLIDANAGEISYAYNAFGEMTAQTNANNQAIQMVYDPVGRMTEKNIPNRTVTTEYYSQGNGLNQVKKVTFPEGYEEFFYDQLQRPVEVKKVVDGEEFISTYTYDQNSRVNRIEYPSGYFVNQIYDNKGYMLQITDPDNHPLWTADEQDATGRIVKYTKGDGIQTEVNYDDLGRLEEIKAGSVHHQTYVFDELNGNLLERRDLVKGLIENFQYDDLERLTRASASLASNPELSLNLLEMEYSPNGNIESKTDAGTYTYDPNKFNAVTGVGNNAENISFDDQQLEYNALAKTTMITEGNHKLYLTYGADEQRVMTKLVELDNGNETLLLKKYFFGLYEKEQEGAAERHIHYVMAGDGITAIVLTENSQTETYFTYKDHLGSILVLTDEDGLIVHEQSFDSWGRYRNADNWTYSGIDESPSWLRGFTGHEYLAQFDLVNMNGRMYDPLLARMLRPDNLVQNPMFTQSYNRYSYVWNNPLKFTDPDGEFVWMVPIIAAVVFGGVNLAIHIANDEVDNFGDGLKAFAGGAIAGFAIGTGIGLGVGVPAIASALKVVGWIYAGTTAISAVSGLAYGISSGDWSRLANTGRILAGSFYLDSDRGFLGQAWQGISRFSWEIPQTIIGYNYTQLRNGFGGIDNVDFFGGATFATGVDPSMGSGYWGVSLGNYINLKRSEHSFDVLNDPLLMHEYGHTFDSQIFGISYLLAIGIPSAAGAQYSEYRANRHAAKYFGKRFNVDWTPFESMGYDLGPQ